MPWIQKPPKKTKTNQRNEHTDHRELRAKAYNTSAWKKVRLTFLKEHPLCNECLNKGKIVPATSIHHLKSPFNYEEGTVNQFLLLDSNNLEAVCHECHQVLHNQNKPTNEEVLEALFDLLNDVED